MKRLLLLSLFFALLGHAATAANVCNFQSVDFGAAPLKRGINLSNWWQEGKQTPLTQPELNRLHHMGFDFVRLPVSQGWVEQSAVKNQLALTNLRCSVVSILNAGLTVIIDLHSSSALQEDLFSGSQQEIYVRLLQDWTTLANGLAGLPVGRVMFSLYNEPALDMSAWWPVQGSLVQALRAKYANTIVASGGHGGWDLTWIKPYPQKNVVYDFHYYIPLEFTHYGATWYWGSASNPKDSTYPNNARGWNRTGMNSALAPIVGWKQHYGATLLALEMGVYRPTLNAASRNSWLKDARQALEDAHIPWALWEYRGSFGILDAKGNVDQDMAKALGIAYN